MGAPPRQAAGKISALVSDVDGTLVTDDKTLTERSRRAVATLRERGVKFAIVSSRPPRGLSELIKALEITTPLAGFNGGVLATPQLTVIEQHLLPADLAGQAVEALASQGVGVWVFSGQDWLVRDAADSYVSLEMKTVGFEPVVVDNFGAALGSAAKIVGVSGDFGLLARCEADLNARFSGHANIVRSQPYYLDITHSLANKGAALRAIAALIATPLDEIAAIGDGGNDIALFAASGFSIAMGNAGAAVRGAADRVTASNSDEGFAKAVEHFIVGEDGGEAARNRRLSAARA